MNKSCCIKDCYNNVECRSMCNTHYTRLRLHGDPMYVSSKHHGRSKTPEYLAWCNMRQRCENANKPEYIHYGGRGITVCNEWQQFEHFYNDMGDRPSTTHSLDRINVNGNYEPGNCRWTTKSVQQKNVRARGKSGHKNVYKNTNSSTYMVRSADEYHGTFKSREAAVEYAKLNLN